MELLDTHFDEFGGVLAVSGMKTLVINLRCVLVVKSEPYLDYFQNTHSKM